MSYINVYLLVCTAVKPTANQHRACTPQHLSTQTYQVYIAALLVIAEFFYLLVSKHIIGYLQVVMYTRDNLVKMLCTHHMNCCVLHIHPSSVFGSLALEFVELCTLREMCQHGHHQLYQGILPCLSLSAQIKEARISILVIGLRQ